MTDPQKDEHIEELLSKLQGIFGNLAHSQEEEPPQKVEISLPTPKEPADKPMTPAKAPPPAPAPAPFTTPTPFNLYPDPMSNVFSPPPAPPSPEPMSMPAPAAASPLPDPSAPRAPSNAPNPNSVGYDSLVPKEDPEKLIVPTAVYYIPGREAEAKSLAQKLETMTPRFTKVAFRLRVGVFLPYDSKSDWKEAIIQKAADIKFRTAFVVMERALEDGRRKSIAADLEARDIYFQEVTLATIEKKAFYTDILLGLVFFFDSRKPTEKPEGE